MKNGLEEEVDFKDLRLVFFSAGPKFTIQSHVRLRKEIPTSPESQISFYPINIYNKAAALLFKGKEYA